MTPLYTPPDTLGISSGPGLSFENRPEIARTQMKLRSGSVPTEIDGVLFRVGPGLYKKGGVIAAHPLDGDGKIASYDFSSGSVYLTSRFVRTPEFRREAETNRREFRSFGTRSRSFARDWGLRIKNCANTAVLFHGGALYALWEDALPFPLDKDTLLPTTGFEKKYTGRQVAGGLFSAHPAVDPDTGEMFNYAPPYSATLLPSFGLTKFNADGSVALERAVHIDKRYYFHDLALTKKYVIIYLNNQYLKTAKFALGLTVGADLVTPDHQPAKIMVFSREDLHLVGEFVGPTLFAFHDVNAYDDGVDVIIDYAMYDTPPKWWTHLGEDWIFRNTGAGTRPYPVRLRLDLAKKQVSATNLSDASIEMTCINPVYHGRRYTYMYGIPALIPRCSSIVKINADTGDTGIRFLGENIYTEEAVFVPKKDSKAEDDGFLIFPALDAAQKKATLWILDARDIHSPPIAVLEHETPLAITFHGQFVPRRELVPEFQAPHTP